MNKTMPGEPLKFFHEVCLTYDADECLIWPFGRTGRGMGALRVEGRQNVVSRYLCQHIHGPAPTSVHQAAHACGNGHLGCVAKRHISWKTPQENSADRLIHETDMRGTKNGRSKLSKTDADAIRLALARETISQAEIGKRFGVSNQTVSLIKTGQHWSCA